MTEGTQDPAGQDREVPGGSPQEPVVPEPVMPELVVPEPAVQDPGVPDDGGPYGVFGEGRPRRIVGDTDGPPRRRPRRRPAGPADGAGG
jgi:hypothetical protein